MRTYHLRSDQAWLEAEFAALEAMPRIATALEYLARANLPKPNFTHEEIKAFLKSIGDETAQPIQADPLTLSDM